MLLVLECCYPNLGQLPESLRPLTALMRKDAHLTRQSGLPGQANGYWKTSCSTNEGPFRWAWAFEEGMHCQGDVVDERELARWVDCVRVIWVVGEVERSGRVPTPRPEPVEGTGE